MQMDACRRRQRRGLRIDRGRGHRANWRGHLRNGNMSIDGTADQMRRNGVQRYDIHAVTFCASEEMADVMDDEAKA